MTNLVEAIRMVHHPRAGRLLNVAIVGGGMAAYDLLRLLDQDRLSKLKMQIVGLSDLNPEAPGLRSAEAAGLFTTDSLEELFNLKDLNLIIELTGSNEVREKVFALRPPGVSVIDHVAARFLWDLSLLEIENKELGRAHEKYLEESKKQTQVILDSLPYRLMVVNLDMTVHTVNETFRRQMNIEHEEVREMRCFELCYGLDRPCNEFGGVCYLRERLDEIKEKGLISVYKEYADEEGETRFDVITVAPIYNENGEVIQILEASRDVTERMRLERELQRSKTFLETVIQSTVDGIVVVDTKGNVLIFNKGMERLTGYIAKEMVDRGHLSNFYDIEAAKDNMRKMRSEQYGPLGVLNPTSMNITTKSGEEIPVTLSASIITIEGREVGSVGVFTDMREFLSMRKELEEAHLQLVQSEKIASVGRMAAGVAHEINNPLSGILMYAEILKEAVAQEEQHIKDVQEIIDQTLRCKKIVSDLLEFSRQSVGKVSSFSIKELIDKALNLLINQALYQDIAVSVDIPADLPRMVGDIGQLQQVFTNLFLNAADAMQGKGKLDIKARFQTEKNQFVIQIIDNGPGIPRELRDKIFDIFFTTKPVGKGTGLGLSISQNIIKLHGGTISLECPAGGGTRFIIELPLGFVEQPTDESLFV